MIIKNKDIQFGRPVIAGTRITAAVIYDMYQGERKERGDKPAIEFVARLYDLKNQDVRDCIKFFEKKKKLPKAVKEFTGKPTRKDCDELWAKVIKKRAGYKCEKSGETTNLHAHHIIPRTCFALRYDLENGVCLTKYWHLYWAHKDAIAFTEWIKTKRDINYLESRRHNRAKLDYQAIYLMLQQELKRPEICVRWGPKIINRIKF